MNVPGLIIAHSKVVGNDFKRLMGLRYWWVESPTSLSRGAFRGMTLSIPRILILHDPANTPAATVWNEVKSVVLPATDGVPQIFIVTRHAV